jgi:dCTP deaminase
MFLSGNIIAIHGGAWIAPFDPARVDCAAYTMRIGDEAFVSPEGRDTRKSGLLHRLEHKAPIVIPPGQFAYLTTREFITLPQDFLGFINMKSGLKNSGLVNVSGFHVDPGYSGKLLFAVFNAGPQTITVRCDQDAFLIWFARLDGATEKYARTKVGFREIDTTLMALIPAETASLNSLNTRLDQLDRRISYVLGILTLVGAVVLATIASVIAGLVPKFWGG